MQERSTVTAAGGAGKRARDTLESQPVSPSGTELRSHEHPRQPPNAPGEPLQPPGSAAKAYRRFESGASSSTAAGATGDGPSCAVERFGGDVLPESDTSTPVGWSVFDTQPQPKVWPVCGRRDWPAALNEGPSLNSEKQQARVRGGDLMFSWSLGTVCGRMRSRVSFVYTVCLPQSAERYTVARTRGCCW